MLSRRPSFFLYGVEWMLCLLPWSSPQKLALCRGDLVVQSHEFQIYGLILLLVTEIHNVYKLVSIAPQRVLVLLGHSAMR